MEETASARTFGERIEFDRGDLVERWMLAVTAIEWRFVMDPLEATAPPSR